MPTSIIIITGGLEIEAELNDSGTAQAVAEALPIKSCGQRWGEEIYFSIPVEAELEAGSREVVSAGEIGYWPTGKAFCLFFGRTPASVGDEIRAASAANIIGNMTGKFADLTKVADGSLIDIHLR